MKHYALTGGIGSGKSTVLGLFKNLGVPTYSADNAAKYAMQHNPDVKTKIKALFGEKAYVNGELNRIFISDQVFFDKAKLKALNLIVHPVVKVAYEHWKNAQNAPYTMYEIPIVFELNAQNRFDGVILVTAPEKERIKRVQIRDKVSKDAVLARMKNQWTDEEKLLLSNYVIDNIDSNKIQTQVDELHFKLLKQSEQ